MKCDKHPWQEATYMRLVPAYRHRNPTVFSVCRDCHDELEKVRHQKPAPFVAERQPLEKLAA